MAPSAGDLAQRGNYVGSDLTDRIFYIGSPDNKRIAAEFPTLNDEEP